MLGSKSCRCLGLTTLPSSCADFLEILAVSKLLEPQGTVHRCNGIPLLLPLYDMRKQIVESAEFKEKGDNDRMHDFLNH